MILLLYVKSSKDIVLPWRDIFVSSLTLKDFVDGLSVARRDPGLKTTYTVKLAFYIHHFLRTYISNLGNNIGSFARFCLIISEKYELRKKEYWM